MKVPITNEEFWRMNSENQFKVYVNILITHIEKAAEQFIDMVYGNHWFQASDFKDKIDLITVFTDVAIENIKGVIGEDELTKALNAINRAIEKQISKDVT